MCRGLAETEAWLIGWHDGARLDRSEDLFIEVRILQSQRSRACIDAGESQVVDNKIGGSVVAHDDHECERILKGQRQWRIEESQHSGALNLFCLAERQLVFEMSLAGPHLFQRFVKDGELDYGSRLHRFIGLDRDSRVRGQVFGIKRDLAVMLRGNALYLRLELL